MAGADCDFRVFPKRTSRVYRECASLAQCRESIPGVSDTFAEKLCLNRRNGRKAAMTIGSTLPTVFLLGALVGNSFGASLASAQAQGAGAPAESSSKPAAANFSNARKLL